MSRYKENDFTPAQAGEQIESHVLSLHPREQRSRRESGKCLLFTLVAVLLALVVIVGDSLLVVAPDLKEWFGAVDPAHLLFAQAGGAEFSPHYARDEPNPQARTGISSHIYGVSAQYQAEVGAAVHTAINHGLTSEFGPYKRRYGLREYMASPSFIFQGQYLSRRTVINYVANKLGGAHLDTRRPETDYLLLDEVNKTCAPLMKPAVYFELLSIGQALINSEDAQGFLAKVAGLPPRPSPFGF